MRPWWYVVALLATAVAEEKKTQLSLVSMTSCVPEDKIVIYNLTVYTMDGVPYANSSSRNLVRITDDWKIVVTAALCSDSVNENVCDYLFEDIEIDNVCELLTGAASDAEMYYESKRLDRLACPLETGEYSFFSGSMVEKFMEYIPKEKPYILLYVKGLVGLDIQFYYKIYLQVSEID